MLGSPKERELATLAINITLQQRNGGKVNADFMDLEAREDVAIIDVPKMAVGLSLSHTRPPPPAPHRPP